MNTLSNFLFSTEIQQNKVVRTQTEFDNLVIEVDDSILLKDIFIGKLNIDKNNVKITGGGIKGSQLITGWTDEGSGIYSKLMDEPKWLYIDNQDAKLCRTNLVNILSVPSLNQITIEPTTVNLIGSKCVWRKTEFNMTREFTVLAYNNGIVTLDRQHGFDNTSNISLFKGVWFLNNKDYFDGDFQWSYESGKVYIKLPSYPYNYTISSVNENYGIEITADNCTINDVDVSHFFNAGISANNSNYNTSIINSKIHHCREDGVQGLSKNFNIHVLNNQIYNCGASGIIISNSISINIYGNEVYNIGMDANWTWIKDDATLHPFRNSTVGGGIFIVVDVEELNGTYASSFSIERNHVYNCAYNGISTHAAYDGLITKNIIHDVLQRLQDGAGIMNYFYTPAYPQLATGIEISYNFIYNIPAGATNCGIYQDNHTGKNNVHHNVVWDMEGWYAIFMNRGSTDQIVNDNTFYGGSLATARHAYIPLTTEPNADNVEINRNIFIQTNDVDVLTLGGDVYGNGDNNYFVNPYFSKVGNSINLAGLQALYGQDANSIELTNYIAGTPNPDGQILLITNPTDDVLNGTAPTGNWYDVHGNLITNYSVPKWESLVLLRNLI